MIWLLTDDRQTAIESADGYAPGEDRVVVIRPGSTNYKFAVVDRRLAMDATCWGARIIYDPKECPYCGSTDTFAGPSYPPYINCNACGERFDPLQNLPDPMPRVVSPFWQLAA